MQNSGESDENFKAGREGEITIEELKNTPARENKAADEIEYVDFEEIKDEDPNNK